MKKLFFALFAVTLFASCGGDPDCVAADYIGVYAGSNTCDVGTTNDNFTVTLTEGSSDSQINYSDSDGETAVLKVDECTAKWDDKVFGIGNEIRVTLDSEGNLTGFRETNAGIITLKCDFTVSK